MLKRIALIFILNTAFLLGQAPYLKLQWNENPEPDMLLYYIHRGLDENNLSLLDSVSHPGHVYYDSSIVEGIRYFYKLQAKSTAGLTSDQSEARWGRIDPTQIEIAMINDYSVRITWSTSQSYQTRLVYGKNFPPDQYSDLKTSAVTDHEVVLEDLDGQTTYYVSGLAIDPAGNVVATQDTSFTTAGEPPVEPGDEGANIVAYPNPHLKTDQGIIFEGLSSGNEIAVYNLMGEVVWRSGPVSEEKIIWDVHNENQANSGVYVYIIKNRDDKKIASGKVVVIR